MCLGILCHHRTALMVAHEFRLYLYSIAADVRRISRWGYPRIKSHTCHMKFGSTRRVFFPTHTNPLQGNQCLLSFYDMIRKCSKKNKLHLLIPTSYEPFKTWFNAEFAFLFGPKLAAKVSHQPPH